MSEEEMIKYIKEIIQFSDHNIYKMALQGLLDLYKNLKAIEQEHKKINGELREEIKHLNEKILSNAGIYQLGFNDGQLNIKDKIKNEYSKYQECFFEIPDENKIYLENIMEKIIKNK